MPISSPNKHSHRVMPERSFEELDDFKEKLKIWENKELQSNPCNKSNINNTKHKFINYFQYQLGILSLAGFDLHSIPPEIGYLTSLVKIDLSGNEIKELPKEIFQITDLEILDLSANLLSDLPIDEIDNLKKLRILNISNNQFKKDFDFKLPNTSIILENPHSLNNFFLLLEFDAKFTENEKVGDYKKLLDDSILNDSQDSLSPQISQDLLSRLKEMNLYF
jgi:Leucine-rich repeat (LRR) protein